MHPTCPSPSEQAGISASPPSPKRGLRTPAGTTVTIGTILSAPRSVAHDAVTMAANVAFDRHSPASPSSTPTPASARNPRRGTMVTFIGPTVLCARCAARRAADVGRERDPRRAQVRRKPAQGVGERPRAVSGHAFSFRVLSSTRPSRSFSRSVAVPSHGAVRPAAHSPTACETGEASRVRSFASGRFAP